MIPNIHNSIYIWGLVAVLCFIYYSLDHDYLQIGWSDTFKLQYPHSQPDNFDLTDNKFWCWNQITQTQQECKK